MDININYMYVSEKSLQSGRVVQHCSVRVVFKSQTSFMLVHSTTVRLCSSDLPVYIGLRYRNQYTCRNIAYVDRVAQRYRNRVHNKTILHNIMDME